MGYDVESDQGSGQASQVQGSRNRPVLFFDIDNCVRSILQMVSLCPVGSLV